MAYSSCYGNTDLEMVLEQFAKSNLQFNNKITIPANVRKEIIELVTLQHQNKYFTWDWASTQYHTLPTDIHKYGFTIFVSRLIQNDYFYSDYPKVLCLLKQCTLLPSNLFYLFENKLPLLNLLVVPRITSDRLEDQKSTYLTFKTDVSSIFLYNLVTQYILSNLSMSSTHRDFFMYFSKSMNHKPINRITDFDISTFTSQYWFYKKFSKHTAYISILKSFYLMLLNTEEGKNILTWHDGVDSYMLQSISFSKQFEEGYKPIPLNPLDPIPEFDKWLVMPNGSENLSTKQKSYQYIPIDFSIVKDSTFKFLIKHWFWNKRTALPGRRDACSILIKFCNYISQLRMEHNFYEILGYSIQENTFILEELFNYVSYVKSNNLNNAYLNNVNDFLKYISENRLYTVPVEIFDHFRNKEVTYQNSSKDIPPEELSYIGHKLKETTTDSLLNHLYYIIFQIAVKTEMRISQILNLETDCLRKGTHNKYYISCTNKVSNGKEIKIPVPPKICDAIRLAIKITEEIRNNCNDHTLTKYIFIHNKYAHKVKVIDKRSFSDYLKRTCTEIGLSPYTARNLRYTYMTNAIEYAIHNNKSLLEVKSITGHKNINTTTNHYVAYKIKEYLEATYMVQIGEVDIKGNILTKKPDKLSDGDLVNDKCGYCPNKSCSIKNGLDCLMCNGFIATLDRIPFFEGKIQQIEQLILSEPLSHDKEHLLVIKRLYLAYLEQLYILQEEVLTNES